MHACFVYWGEYTCEYHVVIHVLFELLLKLQFYYTLAESPGGLVRELAADCIRMVIAAVRFVIGANRVIF